MHKNRGVSRLVTKIGGTAVAAGVALVPMLSAVPAYATAYTGDYQLSQTAIPKMAPGGTGAIRIRVTSATDTNGLNADCSKLTVHVPTGFTLTGNATVGAISNTANSNLYPQSGTQTGTVSHNDTTWTYAGKCAPFNATGYIEFNLPVRAGAGLADGQYTAGGGMTLDGLKPLGAGDTFTDTNAANNTNITVRADVERPGPLVDGRVAAVVAGAAIVGAIPLMRRRRAKARISAKALPSVINVEPAWGGWVSARFVPQAVTMRTIRTNAAVKPSMEITDPMSLWVSS